MRRILFILLLMLAFSSLFSAGSDATLEIHAYKPEEFTDKNSVRLIITDALVPMENQNVSTLSEIKENSELNLSDYIHSYLGDEQIVFSYRIESNAGPVEAGSMQFTLEFDVTPFYHEDVWPIAFNGASGDIAEEERIDAAFSITTESLNYQENYETEIGFYDYSHEISSRNDICTHTGLKRTLRHSSSLTSGNTENGNAVFSTKINIEVTGERDRKYRCQETLLPDSEEYRKLWIARGAINMNVYESDYDSSKIGNYKSFVKVTLRTGF